MIDIPSGHPITNSPWTGASGRRIEQRLAAFDDVIPAARADEWQKLKSDIGELRVDYDLVCNEQGFA